jgi:hypothetical protein
MAAPKWTTNAGGNVVASQSLAAGANTTAVVDFSAVMRGRLQVQATGGTTVSASAGLQVQIRSHWPSVSGNPLDTTPMFTYVLPISVNTLDSFSFYLDSAIYALILVNNDATNPITVMVTSDTLSWPT